MTEGALDSFPVMRKKVMGELREIRDTELPTPAANWDLIWVLSGPEEIFDEKNAHGEYNETWKRFETGLRLARRVTAVRLGKQPEDLSLDDIEKHGPAVYFNGMNEHNTFLKNLVWSGELEEKYDFPRNQLTIAPTDQGILHTGHQFEMFPPELLKDTRTVVVVTSARHIPRVERYVGLSNNPLTAFGKENMIFYPAQPTRFPMSTRGEMRKIQGYREKGILVPESEK